ncbi:S9 family peptidase [Fibrella forsythiae]|uniref:S9 family peptidase n=1 Tax=Fibrella forsythiae TaxID=2817061 RepID=A0ABS3JRY0_9BACT|nr:S9 family peptidase [Fibrella forsythiae]MBO0952213.1 S9 family peptidase [Fibrella forsythiae]
MQHHQRFLLPLLLLWATFAVAQSSTNVLVTDLTRIKQVGGIQVSPTNRQQVLYTLTTTEPQPDQPLEFDYRTHIYLMNQQTGETKALTRGTESARQAVWSPDGRQIAFARTVKGKSQVFVMPLDGGEAYQLTTLAYGAGSPAFSPDGKRILFSTSVSFPEVLADTLLNPGRGGPLWSQEKPGISAADALPKKDGPKPNPDGTLAEIRAYLAKDVEDKKAKVITRLNFQGESTTEPVMNFTHLYVVDVREGATPKPITRGFASYQAATWLPNGQAVLAVTDRDPAQHPDREVDNAIVAIAADGAATVTPVLSEAGKSFGAPTPSPNGLKLAYLAGNSRGVGFPNLAVADLTGTTVSNPKTVEFDRAAGNLVWANVPATRPAKGGNRSATYPAAGLALYFTASADGGIPLFRLNTSTNAIDRLTTPESGVTNFDVGGGDIVFAKTEVADPSALYVATLDAASPKKMLAPNADWLTGKTLSYPKKAVYTNSKGQAVDYWIMKPAKFVEGKTYPLVLNMHGGPTAMWGPGEPSMWHELQYLCAQGYGVVFANPRGSGGYGQAFQRANYRDWGTGPAEDVLAAATAAAREPWVDTTRQVITGGSYAGYLTAWIVGHDNRFKAAFAQRGVYDLTTFMGEGNAWALVPNYFGLPWEPGAQAILDANSPYSFVQNIKTPLLIKHGENDLRTGIIQSEMMYKSLKVLGRPVEYVRMPGATHELSRSGNVRQRIDRLLRIYEFFERFVGNTSGRVK